MHQMMHCAHARARRHDTEAESMEITIVKEDHATLVADGMPGLMTRVEATSTDGWLLYGRPVEEWASEAIRQSEIADRLAGMLASSEGLAKGTREWTDRVIALRDEAEAFIAAENGRHTLPVGYDEATHTDFMQC